MVNAILSIYEKLQYFAIDCSASPTFFGFPAWWDGVGTTEADASGQGCSIKIDTIEDLWQIAINIVLILERLSIYVAIGFIMYGGIMMVISQGVPDKIAAAKSTILNSVIGLLIAIFATAITTFIAGVV